MGSSTEFLDIDEDIAPVDLARISAINKTSVALGVETETFSFDMMISVRAVAHCEIEAIDFDTARAILAKASADGVDPVHFAMEHCGTFDMDGGDGIDSEGDEIAYLNTPGDWDGNGAYPDPIEFDFREPGQPYAWRAAAIVKDLAALQRDGGNEVFGSFIKRAQDALKKEPESDSDADTERSAVESIAADRDTDRQPGDHQDDPA